MRSAKVLSLAMLGAFLLSACSSSAEKASQRELETIKLAASFTTVKSGFREHSAYRLYVVPKDQVDPDRVRVGGSYKRQDSPLDSATPFVGWQILATWTGKSSDGKYDCTVSLDMAPDVDAVISGLKGSQRQMVKSGRLVLARITSQCGPW